MRFFCHICSFIVIPCLLIASVAYSTDFKILIMQDDKGAAEKYQPLINYLGKNGIPASLVSAPNYQQAAKMFVDGKADAMFSGSGVAGILIIKDLAYPVIRPVSKEGYSTYKALILAPKGSPKYTDAKYFKGKKVIFTALASAGEIFYRSIPDIKNVDAKTMIAASHGAAIEALAKGIVDIAIVKDKVWEKRKSEFHNIEVVGEDTAENPDMTLMCSKKADRAQVDKVVKLLIKIKDDHSAEAAMLKEKLGIAGFIQTTQKDFKHTLELLKKAGITKDFNFSF